MQSVIVLCTYMLYTCMVELIGDKVVHFCLTGGGGLVDLGVHFWLLKLDPQCQRILKCFVASVEWAGGGEELTVYLGLYRELYGKILQTALHLVF